MKIMKSKCSTIPIQKMAEKEEKCEWSLEMVSSILEIIVQGNSNATINTRWFSRGIKGIQRYNVFYPYLYYSL